MVQGILHHHHTSMSIGERPYIYNLQFADDINLMASCIDDLQDFTNRLVDRAMAYMEWKSEKSKIMTNSTDNISEDIRINGQKSEEVTVSST